MRKFIFILFLSLFAVSSIFNQVFAWNAKGHQLINQLAYDNLTPISQKKLDKLFSNLKIYVPKNYYDRDLNKFANYAPLPDQWRKLSLKQIMKKLKISADLNYLNSDFFNQPTKDWHFEDIFYGNLKNCKLPNLDNSHALYALKNLKTIYKSNLNNPKLQALSLIFLSHIIADLHQPLHTISKVNPDCSIDYGGNGFILDGYSLHQFWDNGAGWLDYDTPVSELITQVNQFPDLTISPELINFEPSENSKYFEFIYATPAYQTPNESYIKKSLTISQYQVKLSSIRLAKFLDDLL